MSFWESYLRLKSLVRIEDGRFAMHDQLRDMGRSIVADQSRNSGERSRLWKPHEAEKAYMVCAYALCLQEFSLKADKFPGWLERLKLLYV
eukprot:Gb_38866 [translate_table: standard]